MSDPPHVPPASRSRWLVPALAALSIGTLAALTLSILGLTRDRAAVNNVVPSANIIATAKMRSFNLPVRFTKGADGNIYRVIDNETGRVASRPARTIDEMTITCHGGIADVTWYVGNLEPTVPRTGIHLSLTMDARKLATLLKGSTDGIWNDAPASLHTVTRCAPGQHRLKMEIDDLGGGWGIPYADATDRVQRGFMVREVLVETGARKRASETTAP